MRVPRIDCSYPTTLGEATDLVVEFGRDAKVVAGGTDVIVALKQRRLRITRLISLQKISELRQMEYGQDGASIGSLVTLAELANAERVRNLYPGLAEAASRVASPQIRNVGTIGGNIALDSRCWYFDQTSFWRSTRPACFKEQGAVCHVVKGGKKCYSLLSADTVPVLIALGASVELRSKQSVRTVPLEELYTGIGQEPNRIAQFEIISRITIPQPNGSSSYVKGAHRMTIDFPLVGVAVAVALDAAGRLAQVRAVIGGATTAPVRVKKAEEVLEGSKPTEAVLAEAERCATKEVGALRHIFAAPAYKKRLIGPLLREAVLRAAAPSGATA